VGQGSYAKTCVYSATVSGGTITMTNDSTGQQLTLTGRQAGAEDGTYKNNDGALIEIANSTDDNVALTLFDPTGTQLFNDTVSFDSWNAFSVYFNVAGSKYSADVIREDDQFSLLVTSDPGSPQIGTIVGVYSATN